MSWKKEELGKICKTSSGGTPSRKYPEYYENGEIPWVKSGELENNTIISAEECISRDGLENSNAKIFPPGTLLIALYGATIGKLAFLGIEAATNQAVCGIFENEKVTLKYLYYFLLFNRPNLIKKGMGGAQSNISQTILKQLLVPYPVSMNAQMDIVSRIEELFSKLDKGVETLQTIKQQLAVYRQAVLKETFSNVLGKKTLIKDVCNAIKVGIVIKPTQYYVQTGGVFAFRNSNVRRGCIEDKDWVMISKSGHHANSRSEVHAGDVLISRSGVNLGMAAVVPERFDGYNAIDVIIAVPEQTKLLPEYLVHYTNSPYGQEIVKERERGAAQAHLNVKVYGNLSISIPTMEVQKEVVTKIEKQLSLCDNIEQTVDEALAQADAMRQSILRQAFEGGII